MPQTLRGVHCPSAPALKQFLREQRNLHCSWMIGINAVLAHGHRDPHPSCAVWPRRLVLYVAGSDSSLVLVDAERGEQLGKTLRPKNTCAPIAMALLGEEGGPLAPLHAPAAFPWANNNNSASTCGGADDADEAGSSVGGGSRRDSQLSATAASQAVAESATRASQDGVRALPRAESPSAAEGPMARSWGGASTADELSPKQGAHSGACIGAGASPGSQPAVVHAVLTA